MISLHAVCHQRSIIRVVVYTDIREVNLFNIHYTWPAAQFHNLGDAGNGVITTEFLVNEFGNWNFVGNLPDDVPGVLEALTNGGGMVAYIEAVATAFPNTNWAHYATAFDGGSGGQSGFYNVMLNDNDPTAALTWWNGSLSSLCSEGHYIAGIAQ